MKEWHTFWLSNMSLPFFLADSFFLKRIFYPLFLRRFHGFEWGRFKDAPAFYCIDAALKYAAILRNVLLYIACFAILSPIPGVISGAVQDTPFSVLWSIKGGVFLLAYCMLDRYVARQYAGPQVDHAYYVKNKQWFIRRIGRNTSYERYIRRILDDTRVEERSPLIVIGMVRTECVFALHDLFWSFVSTCSPYWNDENHVPPADPEHYIESCLSIDADDHNKNVHSGMPSSRYTSTLRARNIAELMPTQGSFDTLVSLITEGCYDAAFDRTAHVRHVVYDQIDADENYTERLCPLGECGMGTTLPEHIQYGEPFCEVDRFENIRVFDTANNDVGFVCRVSTPYSTEARAVYITLMKHAAMREPVITVLYAPRASRTTAPIGSPGLVGNLLSSVEKHWLFS